MIKVKSEVTVHFCVIRFKTIKLMLIMAIVIILLTLSVDGVTAAQVYFGYNTRKVPIYCVDTISKKVAISFDAAWGSEKTEKIIEILEEYNSSGTFFLVKFWVDEHPDLVKAIFDAGIEIGNHSSSHPDLTHCSAEDIRNELASCNEKIKSITGKDVKLFRCPFGAYNNSVLSTAESLGLTTIQWDVDSLDWKGLSAEEITKRVLNNVHNGSIILMHNNSDNILDGLTMVLDRLTKQGYSVVSIGELIYTDNYSITSIGKQIKNS